MSKSKEYTKMVKYDPYKSMMSFSGKRKAKKYFKTKVLKTNRKKNITKNIVKNLPKIAKTKYPYQDWDGDRVLNKYDCEPLNRKRQGEIEDIKITLRKINEDMAQTMVVANASYKNGDFNTYNKAKYNYNRLKQQYDLKSAELKRKLTPASGEQSKYIDDMYNKWKVSGKKPGRDIKDVVKLKNNFMKMGISEELADRKARQLIDERIRRKLIIPKKKTYNWQKKHISEFSLI